MIDNLFADQKGLFCTNTLGACVEHGVQACDPSTKQLVCDAPAPVPQAELCNGIDDDCDGYVDEVAADLGAGADDGEYVRPAVIALGSSGPWVFAYEASRPDATGARQGSGNGYFDAAPPGEGLDRTIACSEPGRLPWTNVSPWEVEQTCEAIGGRVCRVDEWQGACAGPSGLCDYGFLGCEATSDYTDGPFCNLGAYNGSQDALLPGASSDLLQCASPWADVYANELDEYDVTGNAREIVRCQKDRAVCTNCAQNCCSDAFSTVSGPPGAQQLCGNVSRRRLSGQPCESYRDCCNDDVLCNANGSCSEGICHNDNSASACVARGIACTDGDGDGNCDQYGGDAVGCCDDAPLSGGVCGGASALPHSIYPLLGGSYRTLEESSATCDYSFFKVDWDFRLFDTGFRCCFDVDPR